MRIRAGLFASCLLQVAVIPAFGASRFAIQLVGPTDPIHTGANGLQQSTAQPAAAGYGRFGNSAQYLGTGTRVGSTAFVHDAQTGISSAVGLRGPDYSISSGTLMGSGIGYAVTSNSAGFVAGYSRQFSGGDGWTPWVYDPATRLSTPIGLFDPIHRSASGGHFGYPTTMGSGVLAGYNYAFAGEQVIGLTAWAHNLSSGTTTPIGLFDSEYISPSGHGTNEPLRVDPVGRVLGKAKRFVGNAVENQSIWLYEGRDGSTKRLGLTDAVHTASDGSQTSYANLDYAGSQSGLFLGSSILHVGTQGYGQTAWTYNPDTDELRTMSGLTGAPFVSAAGSRATWVNDATTTGFVTGSSKRYTSDGADAGFTNWLFDPATTSYKALGFLGPDFTEPGTGRQDNSVSSINDAGQVAGFSVFQPDGSYSYRHRSWFFDSSTDDLREIGLTYPDIDPRSIQNDVVKMNEAGQVIGIGDRYVDGLSKGRVGWFYDDDTDVTTPFVFSTRADGMAWSRVYNISPSGTVTGVYRQYDGMVDLGEAAFLWTPSEGFLDLGSLVDGGLEANGWARLNGIPFVIDDSSTLLFGSGLRLDGNTMPFVLVAIPEARWNWAFVASVAAVTTRARSRKGSRAAVAL